MLEHAWAQGILHAWVVANERSGNDPAMLAMLEARGISAPSRVGD